MAEPGNLFHSRSLFLTDLGPMRFYVRPGPLKRQLSPLITYGGGIVCRVQEPGAFLIADPGQGGAGIQYVSSSYITDCVSCNRRLSPHSYRLLNRRDPEARERGGRDRRSPGGPHSTGGRREGAGPTGPERSRHRTVGPTTNETPAPCGLRKNTGTPAPREPGPSTGTPAPRDPGANTGTPAPCDPRANTGTPAPREPRPSTVTPAPREPRPCTGTPAPREPGPSTGTPAPRDPGANTGTPAPRDPRPSTRTSAPCDPGPSTGTPAPLNLGVNTGTPAPCDPRPSTRTSTPRDPRPSTRTPAPRDPGANTGTPAPLNLGVNTGTPAPCDHRPSTGTPATRDPGANTRTPAPRDPGANTRTSTSCGLRKKTGTPAPCDPGPSTGIPEPCDPEPSTGSPASRDPRPSTGPSAPCDPGANTETPASCDQKPAAGGSAMKNSGVEQMENRGHGDDPIGLGTHRGRRAAEDHRAQCAKALGGRVRFSREEDLVILQYVQENEGHETPATGNVLWKKMEKKQLVQRSWQAMKSRYFRYIVGREYCYKVALRTPAPSSTPSTRGAHRRVLSSPGAAEDLTAPRHEPPPAAGSGGVREGAISADLSTDDDGGPPEGDTKTALQRNPNSNICIPGAPASCDPEPNTGTPTICDHKPTAGGSAMKDSRAEQMESRRGDDPIGLRTHRGRRAAEDHRAKCAKALLALRERIRFSREEDIVILQYVQENEGPETPASGNVLWKKMEKKQLVQRSWQAMKSRYLRYIVGRKCRYKLPPQTSAPSSTPSTRGAHRRVPSSAGAAEDLTAPRHEPPPANSSLRDASPPAAGSGGAREGAIAADLSTEDDGGPPEGNTKTRRLRISTDASSEREAGKEESAGEDEELPEEQDTDQSEELHIFEIANMEFELNDEGPAGPVKVPAVSLKDFVMGEDSISSEWQMEVDEVRSSPEACDVEGLMSEFSLDVSQVTQALLKNSGEVGSTRHFLLSGRRPDGFPIWEHKDDVDLLKNNPALQLHLVGKYGADNVAKRVAFLAS